MNIAGLQKMTLLDYPGKVACTVFLQGCNFRCPFCHNSELLGGEEVPLMTMAEFLAFLQKRKGLLDGVCVSGGEPTLQPELEVLLQGIRDLGYRIKLDTNGSRPEVLKKLVRGGLVDYVAMDIKNSREAYPQTCGLQKMDMNAIEESIRFLLSGEVDYEFRTTVVAQLHSEVQILDIGRWLTEFFPDIKPKKLFLQPFVDRDTVIFSGLHAPDSTQMEAYRKLLEPFAESVEIRG